MADKATVEAYLMQMELNYTEVEEGVFRIFDPEFSQPIYLSYREPVVLLRMKFAHLGDGASPQLLRECLRLNCEVVPVAFGLDERGDLIALDSIPTPDLDPSELEVGIKSLLYAAVVAHQRLGPLLKK